MKNRILLITLPVVVTIIGFAIIRVKTNIPPEIEINIARRVLSDAEKSDSQIYARENYLKAIHYYDSAMIVWSKENKRNIFFRSYQKVAELAKESTHYSEKAIEISKENITVAKDNLKKRIDEIGRRINAFDISIRSFPMNSSHQKEIIKCKLQYTEGILAYKNKNYTLCESKLNAVETTINRVFVIYEERLISYLNEYPKWKEMVKQTITYSGKDKSYAIIIDKLARECTLYKDGKVVTKLTVELGVNWLGTKNQQNDKKTPEGFYKIIDKKSDGRTRFYKALLLDYPNDEDKKRFLQNKKDGIVKQNANIGNLIEIHGDGGKGVDWTDGCIALDNTSMDVLFNRCPVGTKVTVVGSTKSLHELSIK